MEAHLEGRGKMRFTSKIPLVCKSIKNNLTSNGTRKIQVAQHQ